LLDFLCYSVVCLAILVDVDMAETRALTLSSMSYTL